MKTTSEENEDEEFHALLWGALFNYSPDSDTEAFLALLLLLIKSNYEADFQNQQNGKRDFTQYFALTLRIFSHYLFIDSADGKWTDHSIRWHICCF